MKWNTGVSKVEHPENMIFCYHVIWSFRGEIIDQTHNTCVATTDYDSFLDKLVHMITYAPREWIYGITLDMNTV